MEGFNDLMYFAAAIVGGFIVIGILAFRFKLVRWGWAYGSEETQKTQGVNLGVLATTQNRVLERLDIIEDRQEILREVTLPNLYVRRDNMEDIKTSIRAIADKLNMFIESCRKGECAMGRK
jgi:hypothetical protein